VPIIEPIPMESLPPRSREIIEGGMEAGLYATPLPLQVFAYRSAQLETTHAQRTKLGGDTLLGGRILELLRIRSAQLGECQPCMQSRKHDSITDDDVACLVDADHIGHDPQERMALRFLDLLSADHHALDADFYRELGEVFTTAQIVELGFACAGMMGMHRFVHTLDIFGTEPPVLKFSPDQIDSQKSLDEIAASATPEAAATA
jgi:alkylhydroperoxidase family enzyme